MIRVLQITACEVVPADALMARLDRVAAFEAKRRAGFAVQLRDPELTGRELVALGRKLRARCRELGCKLLVNDRLDLAIALGADGLHLGRRSIAPAEARAALGRGAILTASVHSLEEVRGARVAEADALLLSPIFASPGKGLPLGLEALRAARAVTDKPIIALGGVDMSRAAACLSAGADGVASIRAELTQAL